MMETNILLQKVKVLNILMIFKLPLTVDGSNLKTVNFCLKKLSIIMSLK